MTLFRPTIVTDVFTFSKQRAIQLHFALENLQCFYFFFFFWTARKSAPDMPEARLKSHLNRCHISAGAHKFKSAVLVSGVPFQKSTLKKLEHILSCKSAGRAQNYWPACQNFGVPCPKWMSCKCAYIYFPFDKSAVFLQIGEQNPATINEFTEAQKLIST